MEILLSGGGIIFRSKQKIINKQNIIPKLGPILFNAISIYWTTWHVFKIRYKQTCGAGQVEMVWRQLPRDLKENREVVF